MISSNKVKDAVHFLPMISNSRSLPSANDGVENYIKKTHLSSLLLSLLAYIVSMFLYISISIVITFVKVWTLG